jgi:hypothetical protein
MSQPDPNAQTAKLVKAKLQPLPNGTAIPVHFNPASLVYTVENSTQQQGGDPSRRQFAAKFTGKLTMDLQFDTTESGSDVRKITIGVAAFMQSSPQANKQPSGKKGNDPAPPVLSFEWGAYQFQGYMESFKETIDFFSWDGIPLRALVSIGLARQDKVFDTVLGTVSADPTKVDGTLVPTGQNENPAKLAAQGGDQNATRKLASDNGLENPRFTNGAALQVGGGLQLNGPVGFVASASAGAGISAGAGAGFSAGAGAGFSAGAGAGFSVGAGAGISAGASAGFSAGASAGFSAGASAGFSAGASASFSTSASASFSAGASASASFSAGGGALFGSQASAGVPATAGAFAGLEVGRVTFSTTAQLDPMRMLPSTVGSDVSAGASASFGLGGVALARTGFSADVGANFNLTDRLTFDSD